MIFLFWQQDMKTKLSNFKDNDILLIQNFFMVEAWNCY